jgi:hypothetical protein
MQQRIAFVNHRRMVQPDDVTRMGNFHPKLMFPVRIGNGAHHLPFFNFGSVFYKKPEQAALPARSQVDSLMITGGGTPFA